jgi:hypothetical protein
LAPENPSEDDDLNDDNDDDAMPDLVEWYRLNR